MKDPSPTKTQTTITVLLVDDHDVVRQGTREILHRNAHFTVVGEAAHGEELAGLIQLKQPDVVLLDVNLPGKNGLQLTQELLAQFPSLNIVFFSAHCELQYIRKAQQLGVAGFLSKTIDEQTLCAKLLEAVQEGQRPVFSPDVAEKLAKEAHQISPHPFTAREQEILVQLAQGLSNQEIAKILCLSVKTVDTHIANLMKKTGLNKRTLLVAYAFEHGLV
jgi:DNA-binding NarL/FixJ family response regulator